MAEVQSKTDEQEKDMTSPKRSLAALLAAYAERREQVAERRRVEQELAGFVTESEKAELAAILERNADDQGVDVYELISRRVLSSTDHRAA